MRNGSSKPIRRLLVGRTWCMVDLLVLVPYILEVSKGLHLMVATVFTRLLALVVLIRNVLVREVNVRNGQIPLVQMPRDGRIWHHHEI